MDKSITEPSGLFQVASGGNVIMKSPFTVIVGILKNNVIVTDVTAMDGINPHDECEQNTVLRAVALLYLTILNGTMAIKIERNCYEQESDALPPHIS